MTPAPAPEPTSTPTRGDRPPHAGAPATLTRPQHILIGIVITGAIAMAAIGFAGSYTAVSNLATAKGFGTFAAWLPIGIDAGIIVCLALDLLLTWLRIPFPLLRQTAWLLTAATIAFNAAAAWPDPLGVGMHGVIPLLFVVSVEAARHAIGRIADLTADKHMDGVRLSRWLLSPLPTFRLWRRMKLWELRSYDEVIRLEQDRLVYQARLRAEYGRAWRRKAPVESMLPLRLARYGKPVTDLVMPAVPAWPTRLETETARETETGETCETETQVSAVSGLTRETKALETGETTARETETTEPPVSRETETPVSVPVSPRETTTKVSSISDIETETAGLLDLIRSRRDPKAVSLNEAIETTGRPKATAAKRLKAARDQYLRETETARETRETETA